MIIKYDSRTSINKDNSNMIANAMIFCLYYSREVIKDICVIEDNKLK